MVNSLEKNFSPLLAGVNGTSTNWSMQWRHQTTEGKSGLDADWVRALGALHSFQSKMVLAAKEWWETHILSNEEQAKWIEDYIERETAEARKRVEDPEAAGQQEQDNTRKAENARLMNREAEKTFQEMMVAVRDTPRDVSCSDDGGGCEWWGWRRDRAGPSWMMMTNPSGWWTKSSKQCSSAWRQFGRRWWSLMNSHNREWGTQQTTSMKEMRSRTHPKWRFQLSFGTKKMIM